jgi:hypothetical protein
MSISPFPILEYIINNAIEIVLTTSLNFRLRFWLGLRNFSKVEHNRKFMLGYAWYVKGGFITEGQDQLYLAWLNLN